MSIIGLIPARGGSKGILRKNIKFLAGKPLLAWTIEVARQCKHLDEIVVSTEDKEIASIALELGANVPFLRPKKFALDNSPTLDLVLHFINNNISHFDWILLLQPTSPLRIIEDINGIIKFCDNKNISSVVSISEVKEHPFMMYRCNSENKLFKIIDNQSKIIRRQDFPKIYKTNGSMYLFRTEWIIKNKVFVNKDTIIIKCLLQDLSILILCKIGIMQNFYLKRLNG